MPKKLPSVLHWVWFGSAANRPKHNTFIRFLAIKFSVAKKPPPILYSELSFDKLSVTVFDSTTSYHTDPFQRRKSLAAEDPGEARARLRGVRGYLVQLPLRFLEKEDLRPPVGSSEYFVSDGVFT